MSIMSNIVRKALVLWACTARAIDRLHCDRRLRQGRCIGAGGAEFCAFLRCFSGKREKRSGVHRQRLVAVDTAGECQDSLHGALVLPHVEPRAVDRSRPGHEPSLPRLAHADGFPFSRFAHRRDVRAAGRKCRGCARGPTTTAARAAALVSAKWCTRAPVVRIRRWQKYKGSGSKDDAANFSCGKQQSEF